VLEDNNWNEERECCVVESIEGVWRKRRS